MRNIIGQAGRKWMLGMTMVAGILGVGAATANAAPIQFHVGFGERYAESYIPPCPGDGYVWTAGYYDGGYWVPGVWVFRGRGGWDRGGYRGYAYGRGFHNEHEREFNGRHVDDRRSDFRGNRDAGRDAGRGHDNGHHDRR